MDLRTAKAESYQLGYLLAESDREKGAVVPEARRYNLAQIVNRDWGGTLVFGSFFNGYADGVVGRRTAASRSSRDDTAGGSQLVMFVAVVVAVAYLARKREVA